MVRHLRSFDCSTSSKCFCYISFSSIFPVDTKQYRRISQIGRLWLVQIIFFQIVLPLSKPVLVTNILFSFLFAWNDFLWPLIITDSQKNEDYTSRFVVLSRAIWCQMGIIICCHYFAILPSFIVFIIAQNISQREYQLLV